MPTKHRRIGVTCDPELDRALAKAKRVLGDKPNASLVRELAVRGADAIELDELDEDQQWLVRKYGARPAKGSLAEWLKERGPLPPFDPDNPTPGTDALEEIREDRLP